MTNKYLILLVFCFFVISTTPALSAVPGVIDIFLLNQKIQNTAKDDWLPRIADYTIKILFWTSMIAFGIGCKDLALSGGGIQLEGVIALFVRFSFLIGFIYWLLSNPEMLSYIPDSLEKLGGYIGTGAYGGLTFTKISLAFTGIMTPIINYYRTLDWTSPGLILVCVVLIFFINCLLVLFIATLILVRIETTFIIIGGMFTAAFFVIGYFRDIFMGYIKALAMNGLKLLLLSLCLNLVAELMEEWKIYLNVIDDPAIIYDTVIPMTFALMAFYIVIKSVPQYAVAILTGHATADGGLAKAAFMAGVGTTATVWNISRGTSNAGASAVHDAAQAYKTGFSSVRDNGGSTGKALSIGALEAIKSIPNARFDSKFFQRANGNRGENHSVENKRSGETTSEIQRANNSMQPGSPLFNSTYNNAQEVAKQYFGEDKKGG